ncbi:CD3324 family protein [Clostridium swellfunianum]|uniref:CD3324 family protein n=1 Tax=Clostridium swellfunianum TaxID=1367462 RepID=UPI002030A72F|nr:CD3324 family protein [Clostridium swellfunianum]MCM0649073.1 CD3324 family protein [Clostridium swellfunianum]
MQYKNGKEILPAELLKELQKYIQGELVYIPTLDTERKGWGENNGTRESIKKRNAEIYRFYKEGFTVYELVSKYNLSEDSIRKIICKLNKDMNRHSFEGEVAVI